ncbi:MAG: hypothetical protein HY689_16645 [Chloroflexi bacterium]|nr:hypothetical protein [Chloroflexota bacterium]
MSQPGVLHIEAHFPQGTGILIYDGSVASADQLAQLITEKTKYPTSITLDRVIR